MKLCSLLLLICVQTAQAFGQSENGLWLGAQVTAGTSKLVPTDVSFSNDRMRSEFKQVYGAGLEIGYMINPNIGVFTGCGISSYRYALVPERELLPFEKIRVDGVTNYLEVPIGLRVVFFNRKNFAFFTNLGGRAALLISDETKYDFRSPITGSEYYGIEKDRDPGFNRYSRATVFSFLHFGINVPIRGLDINVGPEVSYQVLKLFPSPYLPSRAKSTLTHMYYDTGSWMANYFNIALKLNIGITF